MIIELQKLGIIIFNVFKKLFSGFSCIKTTQDPQKGLARDAIDAIKEFNSIKNYIPLDEKDIQTINDIENVINAQKITDENFKKIFYDGDGKIRYNLVKAFFFDCKNDKNKYGRLLGRNRGQVENEIEQAYQVYLKEKSFMDLLKEYQESNDIDQKSKTLNNILKFSKEFNNKIITFIKDNQIIDLLNTHLNKGGYFLSSFNAILEIENIHKAEVLTDEIIHTYLEIKKLVILNHASKNQLATKTLYLLLIHDENIIDFDKIITFLNEIQEGIKNDTLFKNLISEIKDKFEKMEDKYKTDIYYDKIMGYCSNIVSK